MATKIFKLGKRFTQNGERYALTDFVKAVCDLAACSGHYDMKILDNYFHKVCTLNGYDVEDVFVSAKTRIKGLPTNSEATSWYNGSGQTSFIARSKPFTELIANVSRFLGKIAI
jgi:hypothetical protein